MNETQIRTLMNEGRYKEITDSPEARRIWREFYQLPSFEADERRKTDEWERERNTAAFNARMEGGRPLPWHFTVPVPRPSDDVLKMFGSSPSRRLWLQKMYDFVFPNDKVTQATREQAEYHLRIWASIALGKTTLQTKRAYQDSKPTPFLHTIYSAPKRARIFTRWTRKSRFSEAANPEERVTARLYHAADYFFQSLRRAKHWRQCQDGVVFSTNYYKRLSTLPADKKSEGFGKKFFEMPLDEGEEGELFLPSTKSSHGRTEGRELGRSDATLVFDKTTSTFYLQKVKQKKKAVLRGNVLRKERKRADAKLSLFSLPALEKGGAGELLKLWNTATEKTKRLREWKIVSEKFTSAEYLRDDKELMQRFLNFAVQFCSQQAAASIKYKPAVSLSAHRRMKLEEQERMICNSSALEVTEDYAKWVTKVYALLMSDVACGWDEEEGKPRTRRAHGSVRGLGWPDQRYWEPFRDADGRSPASASAEKEWKEDQEEQIIETKGYTISTALRKCRVEELRTTADQSRADDWEGSEQQEISQYGTSLAVASTTSEARGVRF